MYYRHTQMGTSYKATTHVNWFLMYAIGVLYVRICTMI